MKKILFILLITHCSLLFAQWQPALRLTNSPGQSFTSFSNAKCITAAGDIVHAVWYDNRDGNNEIYYKRSTNGGGNWGADTRLTNQTAFSSDPSIAVSGQVVHLIWIDGRDGNPKLYYKRSSDGGLSWGADTPLTSGTAVSELPSITASGQNVHAAWDDLRNGNPEIYCKNSTDGGISWGADIRLSNNVHNSTHASVGVSASTVHIVWEDSRDGNIEVYYQRSTDGGVSWGADIRLTNHPDASHNPSVSVSGQVVNVVWYDSRNNNNNIYYKRSSDGGLSWGTDTQLSSLAGGSMYPSVTVSNSIVHLVWSGGPGFDPAEIYYKRSTNEGLNWEADVRLTVDSAASSFPSVCVSGNSVHVLWFNELDFSSNAEIFYTRNPTGNVIGIININSEIPDNFSLSQNYPNPFNPSTKIRFELPKGSFTKLIIYDVSGKEIETLVNENLHAGVYEYEWNGISLPSGIYFYKFSADNFSETKKMVLIK